MNVFDAIQRAIDLSQIDYSAMTLARYLKKIHAGESDICLWLAVLVNHEVAQGNVCLRLQDIALKSLLLGVDELPEKTEIDDLIKCSQMIATAQAKSALVIDLDKLYLRRFFYLEQQLSQRLIAMAEDQFIESEPKIDLLQTLFPQQDQPDLQKLAALLSQRHRLCILSGGPGTGKTRTVSRILAILLNQHPDCVIQLAAPTGKAAARLSESIRSSREQLATHLENSQQIPDKATTLHRLLGIHRYTNRPRYTADYPLSCDVLVLDEASMIDLQMMAMVCDALPDHARLILLGDKDQLSSVEAGSVFADLCGDFSYCQFSDNQNEWLKQTLGYEFPRYLGDYRLTDQLVVLQKSFRFDAASAIGQLASLINSGDGEASLQWLNQLKPEDAVVWQSHNDQQIEQQLKQQANSYYQRMIAAENLAQAFTSFYQYQILAAVWDGPGGVNQINTVIEQEIKSANKLAADTQFYKGKPLMMSQNLYQYGIHNGDIGIIWPDSDGQLKLWFEAEDHQFNAMSLSQLPEYKTAYAMTVHKSQGSEFDRVLLILPNHESTVCTRELLYTGITRAITSAEIWANASVIEKTILQRTQRVSGLLQRLSVSN